MSTHYLKDDRGNVIGKRSDASYGANYYDARGHFAGSHHGGNDWRGTDGRRTTAEDVHRRLGK